MLGLGSAFAVGDVTRALVADMNGDNEISATGQRGVGDPDGFGSARITVDGSQLCYEISVDNITTPVAAHIHRGRKHDAGPIVVPLQPPSTGDPGASSGCTTISTTLAGQIQGQPSRFYVNVHTSDFPAGAIRGQLKRQGP
jgi:CHRD domain